MYLDLFNLRFKYLFQLPVYNKHKRLTWSSGAGIFGGNRDRHKNTDTERKHGKTDRDRRAQQNRHKKTDSERQTRKDRHGKTDTETQKKLLGQS